MSIDFKNMSADDISECLLDYAKGRLSVQECAKVDAIVQGSPAMLEELEYYKALSHAAAQDLHDDTSPGELSWARLSRELYNAGHANAAPVAANDNSRLWRYATMALGVVVIGQFAAMFTGNRPGEEPRYIPVAEAPAEFSAQITFAPDASELAIRELLIATKATIIAGPSAIGVYQLGFASADARAQGVSEMSAASDIVDSAAAQ